MREPLKLSVIIPLYNRPNEIEELLESLTHQINPSFEVVIIEDGSETNSKDIIEIYKSKLDLIYIYQKNTGPAYARNHGMKMANGNYFIIFDSDCIIPSNYIAEVIKELETNYVDAFGGPDASHESFSDLQKAINYSMTSLFTTGGIRGNVKAVNKFQPRSFNMGVSREVYNKTGGFGRIFPGEDPDFTLRMWEEGFETRLFPKAFVYHKRRISLSKFSKQVYGFGKVRPMLNYFHKGYNKLTFWFPTLFIVGIFLSVILLLPAFYFNNYVLLIPFILMKLYFILILIDSSILNRSIKIGVLSIITTLVQFYNYGKGFIESQIQIKLFKKHPEEAFPEHFKNT